MSQDAYSYAARRRDLKRAVAERDEWTCWICGLAVDRALQAPHPLARSVDHVIPRSKGGFTTYENLRLAHQVCNARRATHKPRPSDAQVARELIGQVAA